MKRSQVKYLFAMFLALFMAGESLSAKEWNITRWTYNNKNQREQAFEYAVDNAQDGDVLIVQNNLTVTSNIDVYDDITVKSRDGSPFTIRNVGRYYICNIHPGAKLTMTNIVVDGEDYSRREDLFRLMPMEVENNVTNVSRLVLQNGATIKRVKLSSLSGNENAAIHIKKGAVLRINEGAMIEGCDNQSSPGKGGAICCDYGTIIMTGGTITRCKSKGNGGAIHTDGTRVDAVDIEGISARGDIYLSGGYITNNTCASGMMGGAIYLGNSGPMIHITGSIVVSNNFSGTKSDDISTFGLENAYANRLKLTGHSDLNPSGFTTNGITFTGSVGVRYPAGDETVQGLRFGGQWEYFNGAQEEPRHFFWNGDPTYRGRLEGNSLIWSKYVVHELPKDNEVIAELIRAGANSPLYIELNADYEMKEAVYVPENYEIYIDLQGWNLQCHFHVENDSGKVIFWDSSVMKSGKVSGHRESDSPTAFRLEGGSYQTYPPPEWIAPGKILIRNYCEVHPYMVASLAWETNAVATMTDLTTVQLADVDNEVRTITQPGELAAITFSTGNWVHEAHNNPSRRVQVYAVAAVSNETENTITEVGEPYLLFDSELGLSSSESISHPGYVNSENQNDMNGAIFGSEDEFIWNHDMSYGLIKLMHITMEEKGTYYETNNIEYTYFKFPDAIFKATQRMNGKQLRIMLSDALLKSTLNYDRASGFSDHGVNGHLASRQQNGLMLWENLVTGTRADELLLSTASSGGDEAHLNITLSNTEKQTLPETGYSVFYDVRKSTPDGWVRVGDVSQVPQVSIPLLDNEGKSLGASGFYRLTTLIVPNEDNSITNELPSMNIVGVLEVESSMKNTLVAVPWVSLAQDPRSEETVSPIKISEFVNTSHLRDGDSLRVANKGFFYNQWNWNKGDKKWDKATTITSSGPVIPAEANEHSLIRNGALWVTRTNPELNSFFLIGQYSASTVSLTIEKGTEKDGVCTLVPNPSMKAVSVNSYNWNGNPVKGDLIRIPNEENVPLNLSWNGSEWGRIVKVPGERYGVWKNDEVVPAGTGFWYIRHGEAFEITLPKSDPETK